MKLFRKIEFFSNDGFPKGKVHKKTEKKLTNVSLVCMCVGRKSEMSVFFCFFPSEVIYRLFQWSLRGRWTKKNRKKLTNVSLVCMYVGRKSEMSVFFCFFPNRSKGHFLMKSPLCGAHKGTTFDLRKAEISETH